MKELEHRLAELEEKLHKMETEKPMGVDENGLPLTLKMSDVAKILGIAEGNAYELEKHPNFPSIRIGRRIIVPRDAFLRWLNNPKKDTDYSTPLRVV